MSILSIDGNNYNSLVMFKDVFLSLWWNNEKRSIVEGISTLLRISLVQTNSKDPFIG